MTTNNYTKGYFGGPKALSPISRTVGKKTIAKVAAKVAGRAVPWAGAAIGANELRKNIPKLVSGVKEIGKNVSGIVKNKMEMAKTKETLARSNAQRDFKKVTGRSYTPADESRSGNLQYKSLVKKYKEKYKSM